VSRETSKTLLDVIKGIGSRKAAAAAYRTKGKPAGVEDARVVYLAACAAIAKEFEGLGFRYAKSGPHFTRTEGPFQFRVSFQSSHHNIPGQHVRLWVHATVSSKKIKDLRQAHLPDTFANEYIAGGMLHRILPGKVAMVEWELADPKTRSATVTDVVGLIRNHVLPYFEMFADTARLISTLKQLSVPALDPRRAVEYALCFGSKESAQQVLSRFISERPDLQPDIERVKRDGFKHPHLGPSGYAEEIVYLQREYGLQ
jgi:hypothetical protein